METSKVLWNTHRRDPRNMIGDSVMLGRDSLYRNRIIQAARVGTDTVRCVTLGRRIVPVYL